MVQYPRDARTVFDIVMPDEENTSAGIAHEPARKAGAVASLWGASSASVHALLSHGVSMAVSSELAGLTGLIPTPSRRAGPCARVTFRACCLVRRLLKSVMRPFEKMRLVFGNRNGLLIRDTFDLSKCCSLPSFARAVAVRDCPICCSRRNRWAPCHRGALQIPSAFGQSCAGGAQRSGLSPGIEA